MQLRHWLIPAVLAGSAAAAVLLMWSVALYQFPLADDFCRIAETHASAIAGWTHIFPLCAHTYMTWSGRWTTFLIHYLVLGSLNLPEYPLPLVVLALLQWLALTTFFRRVLNLSPRAGWLTGALFYAVLLISMPNPNQNLYWFTGAVEYQFTFTTALALFACLHACPNRLWSDALIALAAIFVCGQHELTAAAVLTVFAAIWTVQHRRGLATPRLGLFTAAAALGLALTALAPGNFLRAFHGPVHHLLPAASLAAAQTARLLVQPVTSPTVLLAAFLWLQFVLTLKNRPPTALDLPPAYRPLLPLLTAAIALLIALVPVLTLGVVVDRSFNLAFTVLLFGAALSLFAYRSRLSACASPPLAGAAALALALALIASPNARQAIATLRASRTAWRAQMRARLSAHGPDVVMPRVKPPSTLVNVPGVWSAQTGSWLNVCVARYMHVRTVAAPLDAPADIGVCAQPDSPGQPLAE